MKERSRYINPQLSNVNTNIDAVKFVQKIVIATPELTRVSIITKRLNQTQFLEGLFSTLLKQDNIRSGTRFPGTDLNWIHSSIDRHTSIQNELVIVMGIDSDELLSFEDKLESKVLYAIPWLDNELLKWSKITNAIHTSTLVEVVGFGAPPCVAQKALNSLNSINRSFIPLHNSDQARVKSILVGLLNGGVSLDEQEIEAYLYVNNGWDKRAIDILVNMLKDLRAGKRVSGKVTPYGDLIKTWEKACSEE